MTETTKVLKRVERAEKDEVKIALMDVILHGGDIMIGSTGSIPGGDTHYSLYTRGSDNSHIVELFVWKVNRPGLVLGEQHTAKSLTLKDALALVEKHWEDREPLWT